MHSNNLGQRSFEAVVNGVATFAAFGGRSSAPLPSTVLPVRTHWVTLRLADALPCNIRSAATQRLMHHSLEHRAATTGSPSADSCLRSSARYLNAGNGACVLARPDIAEIVAAALAYSDGCAYHLKAWCIMPNHVHVVLRMSTGESLTHVIESWKTFSAKGARRILRSDGDFWEPGHYQRALRTDAQILTAVDYVLASPCRGSLMNWPWLWSDCHLDTAPDPEPLPGGPSFGPAKMDVCRGT